MNPPRLTRREREKLQHREEIIAAALDVFSEKGFHGASMQDIATRAEFAMSTMYSLFESKEDLYRSLLLHHAEKSESSVSEALTEGEDEYQKLVNYIAVKGEVFEDNLKMVRLYFDELHSSRLGFGAAHPDMRGLRSRFLHKLGRVFESGMKRGVFRQEDPFIFANALNGLTNSFILMWLDEPERHPYKDHLGTIEELFFPGVMTPAGLELREKYRAR